MLQLESVSHVYSFHSYEKNLIRIAVPGNLRQQTEFKNTDSDNSISSNTSGSDFSIREFGTTVMVYQNQLENGEFPETFAKFDEHCLELLLQYHADIYLIGTGTTAKFPEISMHKQIYERKLAIDFMDTGAACRTYNILTGEDRKVAALIFLDQ